MKTYFENCPIPQFVSFGSSSQLSSQWLAQAALRDKLCRKNFFKIRAGRINVSICNVPSALPACTYYIFLELVSSHYHYHHHHHFLQGILWSSKDAITVSPQLLSISSYSLMKLRPGLMRKIRTEPGSQGIFLDRS